jgi:CRP/FNR family transcriptional regulator, cyclic AMP receptor protein
MSENQVQPLLVVDPDLGQFLDPSRWREAERDVRVRIVTLQIGEWHPRQLGVASADSVGLLVASGVLVREVQVTDAPSAELFGPGDLIRNRQAAGPSQILTASVTWNVLERTSLALIDSQAAARLRRYPEVMAVVLDRLSGRADRLALTQAIAKTTGVETRVEMLLWHLAERWGRVSSDGVIVPIRLSHRMLGSLIGARRPTVSTAVARLDELGRVQRLADGRWLLTGRGPEPGDLAPEEELETPVGGAMELLV